MTLPNDPNESNQEIAEQLAYERHQAVMYAVANRITANFDEGDGVKVGEVWERADEGNPWTFDLNVTIPATNDSKHAMHAIADRLDKVSSVLRSRIL